MALRLPSTSHLSLLPSPSSPAFLPYMSSCTFMSNICILTLSIGYRRRQLHCLNASSCVDDSSFRDSNSVRDKKSYPMNSGHGPNSYSKNSCMQEGGIIASKMMIEEAILKWVDMKYLTSGGSYRIADLGCSIGPNTFVAVENIIGALLLKCMLGSHDPSKLPEFQVYFNDHVSNDFNTLFASQEWGGHAKYYGAGVPGSFFGRLFPEASLHFIHSSYALLWLSQVPKEVMVEKSPAWNRGRFIATGAGSKVLEAYSTQFATDLDRFLKARAQEIVAGGLMVLVFPFNGGWSDLNEPAFLRLYHLLEATLMDMVAMGKLDEAIVDSFNLPIYFPIPEEFERLIKRNGSFSIEKMEQLSTLSGSGEDYNARLCGGHIRAAVEGVMKQHFGGEILDEIFERYYDKIAESLHLIEKNIGVSQDLFVLLKRKDM